MKRIAIISLVLIFVMAAFAGCHKHTYSVGNGASGGKLVYENNWTEHWFFGIIGDTNVNIKEICPSGNATIHDEISFINGLVGALIGIIYYPSTVTVRCDSGRSAVIEIDYDTAAQIVSDPRFLDYVEAMAPQMLEQAMQAQVNATNYLYN
ncbi:MAG: hypothetical protein P9M14_01035 [Candidatus Alcyoniella australis]|nr:hypothetical protein [Candidatus Alcyoniella australis]